MFEKVQIPPHLKHVPPIEGPAAGDILDVLSYPYLPPILHYGTLHTGAAGWYGTL